jgi:hypothetical protein
MPNNTIGKFNVTRNYTYTLAKHELADGTRPLLAFQWTQSIPLKPALPVHRDCFMFSYASNYTPGPIAPRRWAAPPGITCQPRRRAATQPTLPTLLYGLAVVQPSPTEVALSVIDPLTGNLTIVGPPLAELFGMSDLVAVANGLLFYLGDTRQGATLVGVALANGTTVCTAHVDVAEVQYVGIGQTLDFDATSNTLVLSGVTPDGSAHAVYRADATTCGGFKKIGTYGDAKYLPMLHASTLDAKGQRLFVDLAVLDEASNASVPALGVIDLTGAKPFRVIAEEATPDFHDLLIGMHFDARTSSLVGVLGGGGAPLSLHRFDTTSGQWTATVVTGVPADWNTMGGNSGVVSALDADSRTLFFIAGREFQLNKTRIEIDYFLASVDIDTAALHANAPRLAAGHPLQALVVGAHGK